MAAKPCALGNRLAYGTVMASTSDDFDHEEVDRLVQALAKPIKPASPFAAVALAAPPAGTSTGAAATPAPEQPVLTPGQRWSNATLLMPAARMEPKKPFALASVLRLPALPRIPFLTGMPPGALSARVFVGLGVLLSAAMPYWPYAHGWSWGLVVYLGAIMLNLVAGIWGAKLTWDERLPAAHTVAVGIVLWGVGLLAAETVPRIPFS
jgi:hypothetical protein